VHQPGAAQHARRLARAGPQHQVQPDEQEAGADPADADSVFGVKSRLEAIEARLSGIEEAQRSLARQLAMAPRIGAASDLDDTPLPGLARRLAREPEPRPAAAPVPPPPVVPQQRAEPRLEWPPRG
jgi:hypothetical protein